MDYPVSMSVTIVQLTGDSAAHAYVSVGQADPSPIRINVDFPIGVMDDPENLQDWARQAIARVCEGI
jgi:hypothetical protein